VKIAPSPNNFTVPKKQNMFIGVIPKVYLLEIIFKFMTFKEIDDKFWVKICPLLLVWKPMIGRHRSNLRKRLTRFCMFFTQVVGKRRLQGVRSEIHYSQAAPELAEKGVYQDI